MYRVFRVYTETESSGSQKVRNLTFEVLALVLRVLSGYCRANNLPAELNLNESNVTGTGRSPGSSCPAGRAPSGSMSICVN